MRLALVTVALLFAVSNHQSTVMALTSTEQAELERVLRGVLRGPDLVTTVRLAFHDCVGGCDGCINLGDEDNAGLDGVVGVLNDAYEDNNVGSLMSRADFWALASIFALNRIMVITNRDCDTADPTTCYAAPDVVFQTGRVDCPTSPDFPDNEPLPSATMNNSQTLEFFAQEFGFDAEETTALMGVHTLGQASEDNSGYKGPWVRDETNVFNNRYFQLMSDESVDWVHLNVNRQVAGADPRWQWTARGVGFMLNTDMCLYKDIQPNSDGESACLYNDCPLAKTTQRFVKKYAEDNDLWVKHFSAVYTKMLAHGDFTLADVEP